MDYLDKKTAIKEAGESLIERFKRDNPIESLLLEYGYEKNSQNDWISPNSKSGHPAILSKNRDMIISMSTGDAEIGLEQNGSYCADAFALFKYYEHQDDVKKAVKALAERYSRQHNSEPKINQTEEARTSRWQRVSDLAGKPVPERKWIVTNWIPQGQVTLFYGDGGTGKSLAAMQLLLAVALGKPWFGLSVKQGSSLYMTAEDDDNELIIRFNALADGLNVNLTEMQDAHFRSVAGEDALLATVGPKSLEATPLLKNIEQQIKQTGAKLCFVDTLADVFPADENVRALARQFISLMRKLAIQNQCAIVCLAHPSLSGMASGTGTCGSTGWSNSVRSRLYLKRDTENQDKRTLELMKSNYSRIGTEIHLEYVAAPGYFIHDAHSSALDFKAAQNRVRRVFMELLDSHASQGRRVNAHGGTTFAPTAFSKHGQSEGITKRAFSLAMKSLLAERVIDSIMDGRSTKLVRLK